MVNDISAKTALTAQSATLQSPPVVEAEKNVQNKQSQQPQDATSITQDASLTLVDKADQVNQTAERLNEIAQKIDRNLEFSVDDRTGEVVISVIDRTTDEVIRQIPEERVLAMRENIESLKGILFSAKI